MNTSILYVRLNHGIVGLEHEISYASEFKRIRTRERIGTRFFKDVALTVKSNKLHFIPEYKQPDIPLYFQYKIPKMEFHIRYAGSYDLIVFNRDVQPLVPKRLLKRRCQTKCCKREIALFFGSNKKLGTRTRLRNIKTKTKTQKKRKGITKTPDMCMLNTEPPNNEYVIPAKNNLIPTIHQFIPSEVRENENFTVVIKGINFANPTVLIEDEIITPININVLGPNYIEVNCKGHPSGNYNVRVAQDGYVSEPKVFKIYRNLDKVKEAMSAMKSIDRNVVYKQN